MPAFGRPIDIKISRHCFDRRGRLRWNQRWASRVRIAAKRENRPTATEPRPAIADRGAVHRYVAPLILTGVDPRRRAHSRRKWPSAVGGAVVDGRPCEVPVKPSGRTCEVPVIPPHQQEGGDVRCGVLRARLFPLGFWPVVIGVHTGRNPGVPFPKHVLNQRGARLRIRHHLHTRAEKGSARQRSCRAQGPPALFAAINGSINRVLRGLAPPGHSCERQRPHLPRCAAHSKQGAPVQPGLARSTVARSIRLAP
jgi:hypothetical protein